ncbi:MAG: zinc ribbon domain-containing protein [Clostridia bacterium]|nr:zinc ribbon domain-containing protein [Clostridia bacterium]
MATCPNCGYEISETASFCTNCGASIEHPAPQSTPKEHTSETPVTPAPAPQQPTQSQPQAQAQQPKPQHPAAIPAAEIPSSKETAVAGVGAFFGLMILFSLPIIGFICCIVFCFVPENKNIRHFAIGYLLYSLLCTLITILIVVGIVMLLKPLVEETIPKMIEEFKEQFQDMIPGLANIQDLGDLGNLSAQDWQKILEGLETAGVN